MVQPNGERMTTLRTRYEIIENEIGPLISESRCTVFDVMELYDAGEPIHAISAILNLTPLQVQTALEYIGRQRATLVPQLAVILQQRTEREKHYRAIADNILREIAREPLTRQRADFIALRERNATLYEVGNDASRAE